MTTLPETDSAELRRERYARRADLPMIGVAVLFLAAYAWPILDPDLDAAVVDACNATTWLTWAIFALDYLMRLLLSRDRRAFFRSRLFDLTVVVLPILRPLRLLQLVTVLNVLNRRAGDSLRGRVAVFVGGGSALVILVASLAVLDAERGAPDHNIESFGDALWWAVTTVTTVGYGDQYPVTTTGRFVAFGLMLAGIALLGVVTAGLASWLIERVAEVEDESRQATQRDVVLLTQQVEALREQVTRLAGDTGPPPQRE